MKLSAILLSLVFTTAAQATSQNGLPATTLDLIFSETIVNVNAMEAKIRFAHLCKTGVLFSATGDLLNCGYTETTVKADADGRIRIPSLPSPSRYETKIRMDRESRYEVTIQISENQPDNKKRELFYMHLTDQEIFSFNQDFHNKPIWITTR